MPKEKLEIIANRSSYATITDVKLLGSYDKIDENDHFFEKIKVAEIGLEVIASPCEEIVGVELIEAGASVSNPLNPSDVYFKVKTEWEEDCIAAGFGSPKEISFDYEIHVEQIRKDDGSTWERTDGGIHHINLYKGMEMGFNWWHCYKFDCTDIKKPKFEFVHTYSLIEGQLEIR